MQATVDRPETSGATEAVWTTRITNAVLVARAEAAAHEACAAIQRLRHAEAFEGRRRRCTSMASTVFDRAAEILGRLGTPARATTALRDSVPKMPRAFDVAFHIDGDDTVASLVLTVVEGYDTVKAVRCLTPRHLGRDVVKRVDTLHAAELTDEAVGELVAVLVEEYLGSARSQRDPAALGGTGAGLVGQNG